ncbi:MAG: SemiSWEET family transporter [Halobacteriota archaeon]
MFWTILGVTAGFICIASFIPQMLKGYRTKKLDDLSYLLMSFMGSGMLLWILYGVHIGSIPVILTNVMGVCCNVLLLIMKVSYSNQRRTITNEERT